MRALKTCMILVLLLFLFEISLALEAELVSEIPIEGRTIGGDILDGRLILSSHQRLSVLNSEGKEAFHLELKRNQGVTSSDDGLFFGITTYSTKASPGFLAAEKFELFTIDGKELWEIEDPKVASFHISNRAKLVVGLSGGEGASNSWMVFYNGNGEEINRTEVSFPQGISFPSNGRYVFANSATDGLLVFDDTGSLKANLGRCGQFSFSSDGEYVATVSEEGLKLFHQGKPKGSPLKIDPLVRDMRFSPEDDYLAIIDRESLSLFETDTGKLLWQHTLNQPGHSFISVDVSADAEMIIAGIDVDKGRDVPQSERHTKGWVYIFDKNGKIIWGKQLSYQLWSIFFPKVGFSSDGKRLSVVTREKLYLFEVEQAEK
jgi:outer membrane protein assembly factor BamB